MTAEGEPDSRVASIDKALSEWRQGDCALGEHWFVHRLDTEFPVTDAGRAVAAQGADLAEVGVPGLVVLTQTCDIVRSCAERPYLEVCPLVEVDHGRLLEIRRGRRPGYAFLPLFAGRKLVADLDRVMTVEKPLVTGWNRSPGWSTDAEARAFALALARKRMRFAYPDDFTDLVKKLRSRLEGKHDKDSDTGRGLRALREIRVQASPSWDAPEVQICFFFIRSSEDPAFKAEDWAGLLEAWLDLAPASGRFSSVEGQLATLEDMSAADYVDSDPLDLDHLSAGST